MGNNHDIKRRTWKRWNCFQ